MASLARRLLGPIVSTEDSPRTFVSEVREVADSYFTALSDSELIEHVKNGFHQALGILFLRYRRLVLAVSLRILRTAKQKTLSKMSSWKYAKRRQLSMPVAAA